MANSVFRKESLDKVSSPEQLNDYIKVSNISVWMIIGAVIVLLASGLIWSAVASLQTTVKASGVADEEKIVLYLADVAEISEGDEVIFSDGSKGKVASIAETPLSAQAVSRLYDEFTAYSLSLGDWNYPVTVSATDSAKGIVSAEIVVDTVKPISFIWNK